MVFEIKNDLHYLSSSEILKKEIEISKINNLDIILEIGPANGLLTKKILEQGPKKLISIEINKDFKDILEQIKKENSNFDFLISNILNEISTIKFNKIIANIPYNITEKLSHLLLYNLPEEMILIEPYSFYKKIQNKDNFWYYIFNSYYKIVYSNIIKGNNFIPNTKTVSILIKAIRISKLSTREIFFQKLYKKRNSLIRNALIYSLFEIGYSKKESKIILNKFLFKKEKLSQLKNEYIVFIIKELLKIIKI